MTINNKFESNSTPAQKTPTMVLKNGITITPRLSTKTKAKTEDSIFNVILPQTAALYDAENSYLIEFRYNDESLQSTQTLEIWVSKKFVIGDNKKMTMSIGIAPKFTYTIANVDEPNNKIDGKQLLEFLKFHKFTIK